MGDIAEEFEQAVEQKLNDALNNGSNSKIDLADDPGDPAFKDFANNFVDGKQHPGYIVSSSVCKKILYAPVFNGSTVRAWDVMVLIPNLAFFVFLALRWTATRRKLRATNSPIFRAFHFLVGINATVAVLRCSVSMLVAGSVEHGNSSGVVADKMLWILLQFLMLATEMSVLVFGIAGGQLDSRRSIRRVVAVAALSSFIFSTTQGLLEFESPDEAFRVRETSGTTYDLFGHGGTLFWMVSSIILAGVYIVVLLLPLIPFAKRTLALPSKVSFYQYCGVLLLIYTVQACGTGLVYFNANAEGLCLVNLTTYLYLALYTPIVYFTFLSPFFRTTQPTLLFSYKAQVDDMEGDETIPNSASMQFSLTQGLDEEDNTTQPIVLNGATPNTSGLPETLASPDSVINEDFSKFSSDGRMKF